MINTNVDLQAEDDLRQYWSVAITASRESPAALHASIESVLNAAFRPTVVDVIVNGNRILADDAARFAHTIAQSTKRRLRVWWLELGDKAHAWNQYIYHMWPGGLLSFMVDGYVRLNSDALQLLGTAMEETPGALGGSGVPTTGRSAALTRQQMIDHGGFHGNFCCIRGKVIDDLKERQFQLPLGLYRVDSTLGAVLSFGLDPARKKWEPRRIHVETDASWSTEDKRWWRTADVYGYLKRIERQAQGRLENYAVEYHLKTKKRAPELFPSTVQDLILEWLDENPGSAQQLLDSSLLCRRAVARLQKPKDWSLANVLPIQLTSV